MRNEQITALVIILLYMLATVGIGLFASRKKAKEKESNDDFLMASKSLGPVVLAGTLFAANTGGASTTGIATNVYQYGLSASWYVIAGGIGFVLVSFIAPYFRRAQANTVPEIISKRYGKASHIFTALTSITALFMATGAQIIATASIINVVTGLNFKTAAIVSTVVVIIYTMIGGFKSVTAANLMHVLFITVGMTVAMFIMVNSDKVGGFDALFEKARAMTNESGVNMDFLSMTKIGATTILGYVAMYFMTFPTGQEIVQTYCSAKDGKAAKLGSILAGVVSALYAIVPAIIGLLAYVCIDGYILGGSQKNALAQATLTFAHPLIAGVVLAAIVAATMSSAAGNMIATATMFTNDIFVPYMNNGVKDDKKEIFISKVAMFLVGGIGLFIALEASNVISVMMGAFALRSAGPFAAFICGLFYKNVTKRAGFVSILVGTIVAAIWIYGFNTPWGLNAMVPGGIVAFIVIFAMSAIERKMGVEPAPEIKFDEM
ncbi:Sodium/glucose cotransporter [Fusobacterium sp. DD29]|uniref:sodium:solute symporter family protein n=1 Tax=unclassified Fusobacterium TaxID=2648384 RepID=UPI001B8D6AF3|nr:MULTISPECIES: sodium:solute symporter family protein [unclassified Fusobacterium]MBR8748512.1 Sodium/glucose cotransporter [Fusobacterium sp. DD29]MBR8760779.1 Sodium/glucose cotransporter [Fusobacterium sp. DD25]MBR8766791.1 Sodium/glucose cotransporter [Fusobacterium sp. DD43]MBR8770792.1 Sodium/glucose cotransporter [Fusobacterium sp. DD40]MBR8775009.1 Sodium/glucose cotransporter [Fusobacterium sp. DD17]